MFNLAVVVSVACGGGTTTASTLPPSLLPAVIESPLRDPTVTPPADPSTTLRVRVYVGAEYRERVVDWESELTAVLAMSSSLMERSADVRLELVEAVVWKRSGGPLDKLLEALAARDPGLDVDLVVGLAAAPETLSVHFRDLVASDASARHVVLRSYNWQLEREALGDAAEGLTESSLDEVLRRRRRHKQSVVLVQGISMLFGESAVLGTDYSSSTQFIDAEAGARLALAIPEQLKRRKKALSQAPAAIPDVLRLVDVEKLAQVHMLLDVHKPGVAWELLEPLLELYPERADIAEAGCLVAKAREAGDAVARCTKAVSLNADNAATQLALGVLLIAGDRARAATHLRYSEKHLGDGAPDWVVLAGAYKRLQLVSFALHAAAKAKDASTVQTWAAEMTSRYGARVGVLPEQEGRYMETLQEGLRLVYLNEFAKAEEFALIISKGFSGSVGSSLLRCEISMRKRRYATAKEQCDVVLRLHPENSWARYLLGVAQIRQKRDSAAIPLLVAAIANDSTLEPAYKILAKLYRKRSDSRLGALKTAYSKLFQKDLVP